MSRAPALFAAALTLLGCGGTGVEAPLRIPPSPGLHPLASDDALLLGEETLDACTSEGAACAEGIQCCNGVCDTVTGTCP